MVKVVNPIVPHAEARTYTQNLTCFTNRTKTLQSMNLHNGL